MSDLDTRVTILEDKLDELTGQLDILSDIVKNHTILVADNETDEQALERWLGGSDGKSVFIPDSSLG